MFRSVIMQRFLRSVISPHIMMQTSIKVKWWQVCYLFLFLLMLSSLPLGIQALGQDIALAKHFPTMLETLQEHYLILQKDCAIESKTLTCGKQKIPISYKLSISETDAQVVFAQQHLLFYQNNQVLKLPYGEQFDFSQKDATQFLHFLENNWLQQDKNSFRLALYISQWVMLSFSNSIFLVGITLLIYITKFSRLNDIKTFRQSLFIALTIATLPMLLSLGVLWLTKNYLIVSLLQGALYVMVFLIFFYRTRFRIEKK